MIWDNFFYFYNKFRHRLRFTRVHAARIFADVAREKWRPKFPKSFMFLAYNSTPLWLLEFCLSIFVVSCSSLGEDSAEFRYVPLYIADQVEFPEFRCSFYKNFILLPSKFIYERKKINSFFITHTKKLVGNVWI